MFVSVKQSRKSDHLLESAGEIEWYGLASKRRQLEFGEEPGLCYSKVLFQNIFDGYRLERIFWLPP